jgi:hypothetical protein
VSWTGHRSSIPLGNQGCLSYKRPTRREWPVVADEELEQVWKDLYPISQLMKDEQPHLSFKQLLEVAAASQCSDTRDKVYGLLALMCEKLATKVVPDYEVDKKLVFISVAKAYILEYQNLDVLRDGGV